MSQTGTRTQKLRYLSPQLKKYSLCELGQGGFGEATGAGEPAGLRSTSGDLPPLLVVEGFVGEIDDLMVVLPLCSWATPTLYQRSTGSLRGLPQSAAGPCILLMDLRRRNAGSRPAIRRIATSSDSTVTLPIILSEADEPFAPGSDTRDSGRWFLKGPITSAGLILLICCAFRSWMSNKKAPSEPDFLGENQNSPAPLATCAERA
jgi:hypothetical protein